MDGSEGLKAGVPERACPVDSTIPFPSPIRLWIGYPARFVVIRHACVVGPRLGHLISRRSSRRWTTISCRRARDRIVLFELVLQ